MRQFWPSISKVDPDSGSPRSIPTTATVMVLAAGEFGEEAVLAFKTLGATVIAVDGYADAPGSRVADAAHVIDLADARALVEVVRRFAPDIVVCESAIPGAAGLLEVDGLGLAEVIPSPKTLAVTQSAERIRRFADTEIMVPTRQYAFADSVEQLHKAADAIGYPCAVTPAGSVSRPNQVIVAFRDEVHAAWEATVPAGGGRVMVEAHDPDAYEVTLLTARSSDVVTGALGIQFCTPIGHRQESGQYVESWQPQPMSTDAYDTAKSVAARVVRALEDGGADGQGRGTFGVRLYVDGDDVRFADVTPYPHDVGMLTTVTQAMSEFEMRARAILGLSVDVTSSSSGAVAVISGANTEDLVPDFAKAPETGIREFTEPDSLRYGRLGLALATADNVVTARSRAMGTAEAATPFGGVDAVEVAPKKGGVQSLKVGAAAQMLPLVVGYGVNLISTPFIVYKLGLHDFGIWAMTGAIAQYAALFDFGVSRAINRYVALFHAQGDEENERAVVGVSLSVLGTLGAVLLMIPLLLPDLLEKVLDTGSPGLARHLVLCAVIMLICSLVARAFAASSFGRGRQVAPNIGLAILGVCQVMGGVIGLIINPTLATFATATAIGSALGFIAVITCILIDERTLVIGRPKAALAREVIGFGLKGQAVGAADIVNFQSGKLIAGFVIGPAAAGAYELGSRLAVGAQAFGGAASVALTTHLTRTFAADGLPGIMPGYAHLTRRNAAVGVFLPFLLLAAGTTIIPFWLGERNTQVIAVVMALGVAMAVNVSTGVCTATIFAIGRPGLIAAVSVLEPVVALVLSISLAMAFGFVGILAALAGWIALGAFLGVWFLQSRIGIPLSDYVKAVRGPFAVALLATIVTLPIGLLTAPDSRGSAILPLMVSTIVFTGVYVSISWWRDYLPRLGRKAPQPDPAEMPAVAEAVSVAAAAVVGSPEPAGRHRKVTDEIPTGRFGALAAPGPRHNGVAVGTHRGKQLPPLPVTPSATNPVATNPVAN